jgi:rare lipoprotein A (peptidoglycan hydrolase)
MLGDVVQIPARVAAEHAGQVVEVQRRDAGRGWVTLTTAQAGADGALVANWRADVLGRQTLRAVVQGAAASAHVAAEPETFPFIVFRRVLATWYGPGFYGRRTACGPRLTRGTLGVAHRTLPCGTPVDLLVGGRTVTVPVVDRGPFAHDAHYDLTAATAKLLGMTQTTVIGVAPQRGVIAARSRRR